MSDDAVQIWVRTDKGQVFGPLSPPSVELLLDNGILQGRVQVSLDGSTYVFPGRMPGIRMVFPKQLWGDGPLPPNELDEPWSKVVPPAPLPNFEPTPRAGNAPSGAAPMAGPGAAPMAGPGAAPVAGPGTRPQTQTARPPNPNAPHRAPPTRAPAAGQVQGGLADELFSDVAAAPPTGLAKMVAPTAKVPSSSASIAAAMGSGGAPQPVRSQAAAIAAAMGMPPPPQALTPSPPAQPLQAVSAAPVPQAAPLTSAPSSVAVAPLDSIPAGGSLRDLPSRRLFFLAAAQDLTGLLTIQLPDRTLSVHFRKGSPDLVDSSHGEDALASFLMRQRLVTPDQLGQAQRELARFGGELLPALFGLGLVNPNVAMEALALRAGNLLGQVLLSFEGAFTFQPIELSPHKAMPAGNRWQLYCEQLRKLPVSELRLRMRDALDFPVMKASGAVPVTSLRLSPQESRAYANFDGTRTLNQLLATGTPEAEHALRVAFMLEPCDLVSFAGTVVRSAPPPPTTTVNPPASLFEEDLLSPDAVSVSATPVPVPAPAPAPVATAVAPVGRPPGVPPPPGAPGARPPLPRVPGIPAPPGAPGARPPIPPPVVTAAAPPRPPIAPPVVTAAPPGPPRPPIAPPVMTAPVITAPAMPAMPGSRSSAVAPATSRPSQAVASTPSAIGSRPSAIAPNFDAEVKKLQELFAKLKTQNHFEVLGVGRDVQPNQVKVAYFKLAKDFHPDTVPPSAPESLSKAKADIFARIGEANRTLSDERLKAEYVADLDAGGDGEKIDVSKFLQAEEFFQKGKLLVQARKFAEALKLFDDSIALIPDDAEPHAWRGYARFFAAADKKAILPQALKDITECTKRNPNIAQAQFFQGMMHKVLGDLAQAKKYFNQTVKLDPKHLDAQRELRMMK